MFNRGIKLNCVEAKSLRFWKNRSDLASSLLIFKII